MGNNWYYAPNDIKQQITGLRIYKELLEHSIIVQAMYY